MSPERRRAYYRERLATRAVPRDLHVGGRGRWGTALTMEEVSRIRALRHAGWKPEALATMFGVCVRTVYRYVAAR